jgi:hypothetical protein
MEEGLVESAVCFATIVACTGLVDELVLFVGLTDGLMVSCFICGVSNMGLLDEPEMTLARACFTSVKMRAGSGGLAEDNGLVGGVILDEESWNIDWGLEGCIFITAFAGTCSGSGPGNKCTYKR